MKFTDLVTAAESNPNEWLCFYLVMVTAWIFSLLQIYLPYLPDPSTRAGYDTRSIFISKRSLTGLNSDFSFSKAEEPRLKNPTIYL